MTGILNYRDRTEIKIVSLEIQSFPLSSEANTIAIKIPFSRIYLFTYERCDILRVPDTTVSTNVARQTITFRLHIKVADSTEYGQIKKWQSKETKIRSSRKLLENSNT